MKKENETVSETFDRWEREFQEEHPILHKIDLLFKNKGYAGYAPHHLVTHPWIILEEWNRQIRWAWQRVFRGWDDRVIWSIDIYIAEQIPVWLSQLKKDKYGIPSLLLKEEDNYTDEHGILCVKPEAMERAEKEYDDIIDKIILGFSLYNKYDGEFFFAEDKTDEAKFNEAFDLFRKYFGTFWD